MTRNLLSTLFFLLIGNIISSAQTPNIIFILADDLGYGDLGCYGQKKIKTPCVDKMAAEGMRFTDFYAGNTVCAPSRCSLLTGKHPGHAYIRGNYEIGHWNSYLGQLPIPENETTIFEILKQKNYATAVYGKWAMGHAASTGAPHKHGVDDFFGYNCQRHAHSYYPNYLEGNNGEKVWLEGNNRKDGGAVYSHDLLTEKALGFIEKNKEKPFFLYLPYTLPHTPFMVPELEQYANTSWKENNKKQAAMISRLDRDVGQIIDLLKKLDLDENTIVFFSSDNGAHGDDGTLEFFKASGKLRGRKRDMYEGGIRAPMIAWWPGKIKSGTVSNHIGAFWDLMPTLGELTGTEVPYDVDGISFLPELLGKTQKKHHHLYWEFHRPNGNSKQAVRKGKWKAVRLDVKGKYDIAPVELYNLDEDISETTNVAEKYPETTEDMLGLMKASHTCSEYFNFEKQEEQKTEELTFKLRDVPFTHYGSGMSIRYNRYGLGLFSVSGNGWFTDSEVFQIRTTSADNLLRVETQANESLCTFLNEGKVLAEATFESSNILRFRGKGRLIFTVDSAITEKDNTTFTQNDDILRVETKLKFGTSRFVISALKGNMKLNDNMQSLTISGRNGFDISLEETDETWKTTISTKSFETCEKETRQNISDWVETMPEADEKYERARRLAAYVNWGCMLEEGGNHKRPAMLMSKNWMNYVWSWDHCFNAIALSYHNPKLAWDQFMIPFDHMQADGQVPDLVGRTAKVIAYVKPPIHGWALRKLMRNMELSNKQLQDAYNKLSLWTNWWFVKRDSNNNGLPEYLHGNDSGWDNTTEFDVNGEERKIARRESANLYAYLILQMEMLRDIAIKLSKSDEAEKWQARTNKLLQLMITNNWNGERFVTIDLDNKTTSENTQSLMMYLPLIIGDKLPEEICRKLVAGLKNSGHITNWGLATEDVNSQEYLEDGYWRGPIWAPPTMIIIDGLERSGEPELARELAMKFCELGKRGGMAENYNAVTGEGLRDKAYSWTASVYLILAHEYTNN